MVQMNKKRAATLKSYTVTQRYVLDNSRFNRHAELTARMTYTVPDRRQFVVVSETGSSWIRNHIFRNLMQAEVEGAHRETQITPDNYHFELLGTKMLDGRSAYLLEATPNLFIKQAEVTELLFDDQGVVGIELLDGRRVAASAVRRVVRPWARW